MFFTAVIVFWGCMAVLAYAYFGYPLLLAVLSRLRPRPVVKKPNTPRVAVLISAYREEKNIGPRIQNLLEQDWQRDKLRILVGTDGSDDGTNQVLAGLAGPGIEVFPFHQRRGKAAVLNDLMEKVDEEIVVFADARPHFAPDVLRLLTACFADESVGAVSGETLQRQRDGATSAGLRMYWSYEKMIREGQSAIGSVVGCMGPIYAIRRKLWTPLPPNLVLDDVYTPLKIVEQGYRVVFERAAKAFDDWPDNPRGEQKRKVRTLGGNVQIFMLMPRALIPGIGPLAWHIISHKLLARAAAPGLLAGAFAANVVAAATAPASMALLYPVLLGGQVAFYGLAILGRLMHKRRGVIVRLCKVPLTFCLLNYAAVIGAYHYFTGRLSGTWEQGR